jgi:hypothetical protein
MHTEISILWGRGDIKKCPLERSREQWKDNIKRWGLRMRGRWNWVRIVFSNLLWY